MAREQVPVDALLFDPELYPRCKVSDFHVVEIMRVMEGGHRLPSIIACSRTKKIVDGVHRWHAALRRGDEKISVDWRDYKTEEDRWRAAVMFTSSHGMNFSSQDRLRVLEQGQKYGLKDPVDFASLLRTSPTYVKALMPRFATLEDDPHRGKTPQRVQRVALKA